MDLFVSEGYSSYGKRSKYRYMDSSLTQRRASLEEKIPDIRKTLDMIEYLRDRRVSLQASDHVNDCDFHRKAKVRHRKRKKISMT